LLNCGSGYPLQVLISLRFTSLHSGLSAAIRQLFGVESFLSLYYVVCSTGFAFCSTGFAHRLQITPFQGLAYSNCTPSQSQILLIATPFRAWFRNHFTTLASAKLSFWLKPNSLFKSFIHALKGMAI